MFELRQLALPGVLKGIGRNLLQEFFAHFQRELEARQLPFPDSHLPDDAYYEAVILLLNFPECLPQRLNETLFAIEAMCSPEGQECLHAGIAHTSLKPPLDFDCSPERLTMEAWLKSPNLLLAHNHRDAPAHLSSFECFAASTPKSERAPFVAPDAVGIHRLTVPIVLWFSEHHHAVHSTQIDFQPMDRGQNWFRVRHDDTSMWSPQIGDHETEFLHFRPQHQETILYSAEDDELWICSRTDAERELYRQQFGLILRASRDYFSQRRTFRLEPLRATWTDALDVQETDGIREIILREIQVKWAGAFRGSTTHSSDEVFTGDPAIRARNCFLPSGGTLIRAGFLLRFPDSPVFRAAEICAPHKLKVEHPTDLLVVARWAIRRGFCNL